jgi:hypothetical protein
MLDDCLDDWVGLDAGCEPAAGLYVNALPGVSLEGMEAGADGEQAHYTGVWRAARITAFARFRTDVWAALGECFRPTLSHGPMFAGRPDRRSMAPRALRRGMRFDLACGDFALVFVRSVQILLLQPATVTLTLSDGAKTLEFHTAGNAPVAIGESFLPALEIFYQAADVHAAGGPAGENVVGFDESGQTSDQCYGLRVEYEIRCHFDRWLCSMREPLRTPLFFLLGAEVIRQRLGSDRFNRFTAFDREGTRALAEFYQAEYEKSLRTVCRSLTLPHDPCFCIDPPTQTVYV